MVTRKIQGSPTKITGVTPDGQEFESALEEDFFFLLRFDDQVDHWGRPEESIVWYDDSGKHREYTPDALVFYKPDRDGRTRPPKLFEVKPNFAASADRPVSRRPRKESAHENEQKWEAARRECHRLGWEFEVVLDTDIRTDLLVNARFLTPFRERPGIDMGAAQMLDIVRDKGSTTIADLLGSFASDPEGKALYRPTLYKLLATRQISVDLSVILNDQAVICLPDEAGAR